MKKGLIKEAFRLQQIAGITSINEIGDAINHNVLDSLGAFEDENGDTVVSDLVKNERFIEDKLTKAGVSFNKEYDKDIHGQKIVIFVIGNKGINEAETGAAEVQFSPNELKSVSFPNGLEFEVGGEDMEGGVVTSIEKTQNGYAVSGFDRGEGYTYHYDANGNEVDED